MWYYRNITNFHFIYFDSYTARLYIQLYPFWILLAFYLLSGYYAQSKHISYTNIYNQDSSKISVKNMVEYIDCYPEYLRLENFIKIFLKTLSCSFLPWDLFCEYGKYLIHIYHLYFFLTLIASSFYFANDISTWSIIVAEFITVTQITIKYLSILKYKEGLNQLFLWIRQLHATNELEFISNSGRKHLKTNFMIILRILKYV